MRPTSIVRRREPFGQALRVLFVIPGPPKFNNMIFVRRQATALQERGLILDIHHLHSWKSLPVLLIDFVRLSRRVRMFQPDLVHAQFGTMTSALCAFCTHARLVITYRGSDLNPAADVNPLRVILGHVLSQLSALRASRIVCVSDKLKTRLWWRKNRSVTIPSPVDANVFFPIPRMEARHRLGWNQSERVVLFNSGIGTTGKGLDIAEAAIKIAIERVGPIRLHVLRGDVAPPEMPLYINASNCVLLASRWEGSPNIVKEALACNTPVVATDVGDVAIRLNGVRPSRIALPKPSDLGKALADILLIDRRSNGREKLDDVLLETTTLRLMAVYAELQSEMAAMGT